MHYHGICVYSVSVIIQVTKKMEGVTKALDKAMASMDLEKVLCLHFMDIFIHICLG